MRWQMNANKGVNSPFSQIFPLYNCNLKTNVMTQADRNLELLKNFILHITHCSDDREESFHESMEFTPEELYQLADSYIEEDHVDGKGNSENVKEQSEICEDCVNSFDDPQKCRFCTNGSNKTLAQ